MNYQRRTRELREITITRKNDSGSFDATLNFSLIPRGIGSMPLVAVRGKANRDSKSAWTERKITVSANIYPATRGGNVRLDSDSELISFEIPSSIYPPTSSTSATHSSPSSLSLSSRIVVHHPRPFPSSLSLSRSLAPASSLLPRIFLSISLSPSFPLTLTPSSSLFSSLSSFSNLIRASDAYVQRDREQAKCISIRTIFLSGRICVSSLEMGGGGGKKKEERKHRR